MSYVFLSHTADVKFRAVGDTLSEMFVSAAGALNETIRGEIKIVENIEKQIELQGSDFESLLYNFLEEMLIRLDSEDFLVSTIKNISIDEQNFSLKATFVGDKAENYVFTNDVKAVTYSEMFVKKENEKWACEVVLDV